MLYQHPCTKSPPLVMMNAYDSVAARLPTLRFVATYRIQLTRGSARRTRVPQQLPLPFLKVALPLAYKTYRVSTIAPLQR